MLGPLPPDQPANEGKRVGMGCLTLFGVVFLLWLAGTMISGNKTATPPTTEPRVATIDHSPEKQADRLRLINNLISLGLFSKVSKPGELPYVHVRRAFYELDFEQKQKFVSVVYAYYYDGSEDDGLVRIFDARTNKDVGRFSPALGLEIKDPR